MIGRGGMGAVYQGWQKNLHRLVAIKVLPPQMEERDASFAERFKREACAMAQFKHPGIVSVYDAGETADGLLYFVMEFVEGTDVQKLVQAQGRLSPEHALGITAHVCDALAYAHKRGVVHRDIKPSNVMVDSEGQVKVADFGLAKVATDDSSQYHTGTHVHMGTPDFMAPEMAMGLQKVDQRVDIYAVGVMLYQTLTGELPRGRFEPPSRRIVGLDVRVDAIIDHALQPDPDKRYSTAVEMRTDLNTILPTQVPHPSALQMQPPPPSPAPVATTLTAIPRGPAARKSKGSLYAGLIAAGLVIGVVGYLVFKPKLETPAKTQIPTARETVEPSVSAHLDTATKDQPFVNTLGMKFVPVPGTKVLFSIWDTRVGDYAAYARVNKVDGFWQKQEGKGVPISREPEYPVVGVTWDDAQGFCHWLTEKEAPEGKLPKGARYRLPTDEEWSIAVGMLPEQGSTPSEKDKKNKVDYPWGIEYPPSKPNVGNYADSAFHEKFPGAKNWIEGYTDGYPTTSPVGSFPANKYGLYDMGGNVLQWCEDWFDNDQKRRVRRGSAWLSGSSGNRPEDLLSSGRGPGAPNAENNYVGFRCVLEPAR
jgi:serine/threonine protein kinase